MVKLNRSTTAALDLSFGYKVNCLPWLVGSATSSNWIYTFWRLAAYGFCCSKMTTASFVFGLWFWPLVIHLARGMVGGFEFGAAMHLAGAWATSSKYRYRHLARGLMQTDFLILRAGSNFTFGVRGQRNTHTNTQMHSDAHNLTLGIEGTETHIHNLKNAFRCSQFW